MGIYFIFSFPFSLSFASPPFPFDSYNRFLQSGATFISWKGTRELFRELRWHVPGYPAEPRAAGPKASASAMSISCEMVGLRWLTQASLVAQMIKNLPAMWETQVWSWVGKFPWRREWQPTSVLLPGEFHGQRSLVKNPPANEGDVGSIPESGRPPAVKWQHISVFLPGKFHGQRSMVGYIVHRMAKSQTWLSNWTCMQNSAYDREGKYFD